MVLCSHAKTLYHGTSLIFQEKGIFLRGKPGSGKSDLALRLIHQGAILVADDQTDLCRRGNQVMMSPPKALEGKLEVRGIGIVKMDFSQEHPLDMLLDLTPWRDIERLPGNGTETLEGIQLPRYRIDPFELSVIEKILTLCQGNLLCL